MMRGRGGQAASSSSSSISSSNSSSSSRSSSKCTCLLCFGAQLLQGSHAGLGERGSLACRIIRSSGATGASAAAAAAAAIVAVAGAATAVAAIVCNSFSPAGQPCKTRRAGQPSSPTLLLPVRYTAECLLIGVRDLHSFVLNGA